MGDRALIQLKSGDVLSPHLYLHWSGGDVPALLKMAAETMEARPGDVEYAFARLVYHACAINGGGDSNLAVGVLSDCTLLTYGDSHGDAGVFVVDVSKPVWEVLQGGGYEPRPRDQRLLHWEEYRDDSDV